MPPVIRHLPPLVRNDPPSVRMPIGYRTVRLPKIGVTAFAEL